MDRVQVNEKYGPSRFKKISISQTTLKWRVDLVVELVKTKRLDV